MFAPLGKLDEGEEIIPIPPDHLLPDRRRRRPLPLSLVVEGEFPAGITRRFRTRAPHEGVEESDGLVGTFPGQKEPRRGEAVAGMAPGGLPGGIDQFRQMGSQGGKREDVEAVVFEDVGHETAVAAPEPVEVALGDLAPGDVPLSFEPQERRLQGSRAGGRPGGGAEAAGRGGGGRDGEGRQGDRGGGS